MDHKLGRRRRCRHRRDGEESSSINCDVGDIHERSTTNQRALEPVGSFHREEFGRQAGADDGGRRIRVDNVGGGPALILDGEALDLSHVIWGK